MTSPAPDSPPVAPAPPMTVDEAVVLLGRAAAVLCALRHAVESPEVEAQRLLAEDRASIRATLARRAEAGWPADPDGRLREARARVIAHEEALHASLAGRADQVRSQLVAHRSLSRAIRRYAA